MDLVFKNSSCNQNIQNLSCSMRSFIHFFTYQLVWVSNPDKSKLNTFPQSPQGSINTPISLLVWSMNFLKNKNDKPFLFSEKIVDIPPTSIHCNNLKWLPDNKNQIDDISFETFQKSSETDFIENKIVMSYKDVHFTRKNNDLVFSSIKPYRLSNVSNLNALAAEFVSEIMGISFYKNRNICHFTIERNTSKSLLFQKSQKKMTDYRPISFNNLDTAIKTLSLIQQEELRSFDRDLADYIQQLPPVVQLLDVYGIAKIHFKKNSKGYLHADIDILDIL